MRNWITAGLIAVAIVSISCRAENDGSSEELVDDDSYFNRPDDRSSLASLSRDEQLQHYAVSLDRIRHSEIGPALNRFSREQARHAALKSSMPWLPSADQRAGLSASERQVQEAAAALARVRREESAIISKMKPLYGIVSYEFVHEQQTSISQSVKKVNEMAYNHAWFSSVWNIRRAESISDLIMGFFVEWFMSYVIMYPFALGYYAFWSLPWSLYEYSSNATDLIPAVVMYVAFVGLMSLPVISLVGGFWYLKTYRRHDIEAFLEQRRRRNR